MLYRVGGDVADRAVKLACRPDVLTGDLEHEFRKSLEQTARGYALEELDDSRDRVARVHLDEEVNMIGHYLKFVYGKAVLFRDLAEEHVARLFNELVVEYWSSIFWDQDDVVGQLSEAMAI